jgi:N-acetylmuramoyl-L-alanine amidase
MGMKINVKALSLAVAAAVTVAAMISAGRPGGALQTGARHLRLPTVIIDAGHGGFDGGAVAADGTNEKDINLEIALKLQQFLTLAGFDTVMVRTTDCSVDSGGDTIRERKRSDLNNRFALMGQHDGAVYLCIHQNKYSGSSVKGAQVFYTPGNEQSKRLAGDIQNAIAEKLQTDNKRKIKQCDSSVYIIHNAPTTAVLVECGFISNQTDLHNLKDQSYQSKLAFTISAALVKNICGG